jgi:hypothetical protein
MEQGIGHFVAPEHDLSGVGHFRQNGQRRVWALRFGAFELRDHIPVVKDRSRDQMQKKNS